ncbi:hypothetical protein EYF80_021878 [Liparis tanakae]|uniref:Secreted protein n=1 Tax=Liparis tanakae TaxID=230148 RepID=A0A4Z2HPZ0_9TELE|nr:hypothetical protein EYF80_021878 [Liparis tanakae]
MIEVQMLGSTCVLPFLALCMLPQETSSAVLPDRFRDKREVNWLDQELFLHRSDQGHLSVGDDGELDRDVDQRPPPSETVLAPTEHLPPQRKSHHQNHRKAHEKR